MRPLFAFAFVPMVLAVAGCGVLGLGKKPSPYQGVLRLETGATVPIGRPLRVAVHNDSPRPEAFDPCRDLHLERFDGLVWTPVTAYTPCTQQPRVALRPGTGTALDLAPAPAGTGYRLVLRPTETPATAERRTRPTRAVQSSNPFTVTR